MISVSICLNVGNDKLRYKEVMEIRIWSGRNYDLLGTSKDMVSILPFKPFHGADNPSKGAAHKF